MECLQLAVRILEMREFEIPIHSKKDTTTITFSESSDYAVNPMTLTNPPHNWEEEEVENPAGHTDWVYNSLTNELTVLRTVEIEDGEYAPWDDLQEGIESAVLVDGVAFVCDRAFIDCRRLKSVHIPKSVTSIGEWAFACCEGLESITIPDSVKTIGLDSFSECGFSSIKIPRSVVSFDGNPFVGCEYLTEIDVSENPNFVWANGVLMNE